MSFYKRVPGQITDIHFVNSVDDLKNKMELYKLYGATKSGYNFENICIKTYYDPMHMCGKGCENYKGDK